MQNVHYYYHYYHATHYHRNKSHADIIKIIFIQPKHKYKHSLLTSYITEDYKHTSIN